jgi:hypothetical protein
MQCVGQDWTCVTESAEFEPRFGQCVVAHDDALFLFGGQTLKKHFNDMWISKDSGLSWTLHAEHSPWCPRSFLAAASINGLMYMTGGLDRKQGMFNDVWVRRTQNTITRFTSYPLGSRART